MGGRRAIHNGGIAAEGRLDVALIVMLLVTASACNGQTAERDARGVDAVVRDLPSAARDHVLERTGKLDGSAPLDAVDDRGPDLPLDVHLDLHSILDLPGTPDGNGPVDTLVGDARGAADGGTIDGRGRDGLPADSFAPDTGAPSCGQLSRANRFALDDDTLLQSYGGYDLYGKYAVGLAHACRYRGGRWIIEQRIQPPLADSRSYLYFGEAMSVNGRLAVFGSRSTYAYIFEQVGEFATWRHRATIRHKARAVVAGTNRVVVASGPISSTTGGGSVAVYRRSGSAWVLEAKLTTTDQTGRFGVAVSMDDKEETIAVGDDYNGYTTGRPGPGAVYVYRRASGSTSWTQEAKLTVKRAYYLGETVSIAGNRIAVASRETFVSAKRIYIFERQGTTWTQTLELRRDKRSGRVALDGSRLMDGLRVYRWGGLWWILEADLTGEYAYAGTTPGLAGDLWLSNGTIYRRVSGIWRKEWPKPPVCTGGKALCGGKCFDLQSSSSHCGSCFDTCATERCVSGVCQPREIPSTEAKAGPIAVRPWAAAPLGYWGTSSALRAGRYDGTGSNVAINQVSPQGLVFDDTYYTVRGYRLFWTTLDGFVRWRDNASSKVTNLASGRKRPSGIAAHGTYVYWAERGVAGVADGAIWRTPKTGGSPTKLGDAVDPTRISVDDTGVYYLDGPSGKTIYKLPLTGGTGAIVATGLGEEAVAISDRAVYWIDSAGLYKQTLAANAYGAAPALARTSSGVVAGGKTFSLAGSPTKMLSLGKHSPTGGIAVGPDLIYWTHPGSDTVLCGPR